MEIRALALPAALFAASAAMAAVVPASAGASALTDPLGASALTTGSISGETYEDADAGGTRDPGDEGREGFSVYADLDDDGLHDPAEPAAASDRGGAWRLAGLAPGSYRIRLAARTGWTCSAPAACAWDVDLNAGDEASGRDFGAWRAGRLLGTTFEDADRDGVRDEGELPQARRTLYVDQDNDGAHDDGEPQATSGIDGSFAFTGLRPGARVLREALPDGWHCSMPAPCFYETYVASGLDHPWHDFGSWSDPVPGPSEEPSADDPPAAVLLGAPTLRVDPALAVGADHRIWRQSDAESGRDTYFIARAVDCVPMRVDLPIDAEAGAVLDVQMLVTFADGTVETRPLSAGSAGVWSATIDCARDAELGVVVKTAGAETRLPVGEVVLIDPSGIVYDARLYGRLARDGASAETARCASALSGATVTLERRTSGGYRAVSPDDARIAPNVNPQRTDAAGSFGWQVSKGEYRVRVSRKGYHSKSSRTVTAPSAVLDMHVALERRAGTPAPDARDCGAPTEGEPAGEEKPEPAEKPAADKAPACLLRPVNARVRGRAIRHVVFYLDGRRVRKVSRPDGRARFGITVSRSSLGPGKHVLRAKVVFIRRADRRPAWLTLPIRRCAGSSTPKAIEISRRPGCGTRPFVAWVRGDRVRRVTFRLAGRRLGTVTAADWRGRYAIAVDPTQLSDGRHVLSARVELVPGPGARFRTLQLPFQRCG